MPSCEHETVRVLLATSNKGKIADFQLLFEGSGVTITAPSDLGVRMDVEETGTTFEENALLKARAFCQASGLATLADDSGLEVAALDGRPGVYSSRYAGPECDDHANNLEIIREMTGIDDRRAAFVCALALVLPDGTEVVTHGRCEGTVIDKESGHEGFGYDVIFYREDLGRTFGESSPQEKNARSHRAAAARAMIAEIRERGLLKP
jgi:XTP/dITP diphosphohydrolase